METKKVRTFKEICETEVDFSKFVGKTAFLSFWQKFVKIGVTHEGLFRFEDGNNAFYVRQNGSNNSDNNIKSSRVLFTVEEAAELGYNQYEIGECGVFWDNDLSQNVLSVLTNRVNNQFANSECYNYRNFISLKQALTDPDFRKKFNIDFEIK